MCVFKLWLKKINITKINEIFNYLLITSVYTVYLLEHTCTVPEDLSTSLFSFFITSISAF